MTVQQINPERLAALDTITLDDGSHGDFASGHCAMEVVAWLAEEGHTDAPACASPVLARYTIRLNDRWDDGQRQALKPFLPRMVGTGGDGKDALRERIAFRAVVDLLVPWLRLAGLDDEVAELQALADDAPLSDLRRVVREASDAAWRIRTQRRNELKAKILEHLKNRPVAVADAVADAVAAAVAAADAVAAAVAVAAADADAAAAADADAVAAADGPHATWSAAYTAARAYYREHPLPISQQVADLATEQKGAALDLLDWMIDPAVTA